MLLDERIVAIEQALERAGIPHAFGGANAFAFYGVPRATVDIEVSVTQDDTELFSGTCGWFVAAGES